MITLQGDDVNGDYGGQGGHFDHDDGVVQCGLVQWNVMWISGLQCGPGVVLVEVCQRLGLSRAE